MIYTGQTTIFINIILVFNLDMQWYFIKKNVLPQMRVEWCDLFQYNWQDWIELMSNLISVKVICPRHMDKNEEIKFVEISLIPKKDT